MTRLATILAVSLVACATAPPMPRVSPPVFYTSERWGTCLAIETSATVRAYSAHACVRPLAGPASAPPPAPTP